ncbi:four helix bundle protein [Lacihabitans sp. CCS-44]|uniref:four helix bundle protein n=1 Tax=Lacihabitans sp. CCS-44 TaxID=2487331 RepID=UPI0020CE7E5D|nr:four helix bundle protein [Lacihabitans sp. CCS-44]MCP9757154.1 four helix bundle protein [Lacihabitans sp. CCS-44]
MESVKESIIKVKSFQFAVRVVKLYKYLVESKKEYVMAKQFLKSGTSIGANVREAHNAESMADFIHKLAIAQKECDETLYWLELLKESDYLNELEFNSIYPEAVEILKIVKSIIITMKKKKI